MEARSSDDVFKVSRLMPKSRDSNVTGHTLFVLVVCSWMSFTYLSRLGRTTLLCMALQMLLPMVNTGLMKVLMVVMEF